MRNRLFPQKPACPLTLLCAVPVQRSVPGHPCFAHRCNPWSSHVEFFALVFLIVLNGLFAMSEIALVTAARRA